jgi:hypothetical protein
MGLSMQPDTRYAKSGDVHIAYQVFGEGPINLVLGYAKERGLIHAGGVHDRPQVVDALI